MNFNKKDISIKQMSSHAVIGAVALVAMLIISIIISNVVGLNQIKDSVNVEAGQELVLNIKDFFDVNDETAAQITFDTSKVDVDTVGEYEATAKYKNKTYTIKVNVVDTTAPKVMMDSRYVFTNDVANTDYVAVMKSIQDVSEYQVKAIRFEHLENLKVLDENALNGLTEQINTHAKAEDLLKMGTDKEPETEGIYKVVLEIADVHENAAYEEIILILDKTGAKIEDVPDKTVTVSADQLSAEPAVDKSEYTISDNVDGKITAESIITKLELRDEAKHEWLVHVSYVDRAGNESKADFLIIVKEGSSSQSGGGNSSDGGNANNGGTSNQGGSNANTQPEQKPSNNQDVSTWVPTDDENDISPYEQMVIDAGYGNVVQLDDGAYAVLTHGDGNVNGKDGGDILREYLAQLDLSPQNVSGGWIDSERDWYWYIAKNLQELITSDEEEFWD